MPPRSRKNVEPTSATEETVEPASEDASATADADPSDAPPVQDTAPAAEPEPERSEVQLVENPCSECFPGGWPEQSYALGCTHGTWQREATG